MNVLEPQYRVGLSFDYKYSLNLSDIQEIKSGTFKLSYEFQDQDKMVYFDHQVFERIIAMFLKIEIEQ